MIGARSVNVFGTTRPSRLAPQGRDGRFDFYVAINGGSDWHDLEGPGRRLKWGRINQWAGVVGAEHECDPLEAGRAISESSSSHLPPNVGSVVAKPVMFPPGR